MKITPHYDLKIDKDLLAPERVYAVSFVDKPAIEAGWMAFSDDLDTIKAEPIQVKFASSIERMEVTGPILIPDKVILRRDPNTNELFTVSMGAETIASCMEKFMSLGYQNQTNVNHEDPSFALCTMIETWIVTDPQIDKSIALGMEPQPAGTWMGTWKIRDEKLWAAIKAGELTGFSIEGWFNMMPSERKQTESVEAQKLAELQLKAETVNSEIHMNTKPKLTFGKFMLATLATLFGASAKMLLADHSLKDGTKIQIDDESGDVYILDAEGVRGDKVPDGIHQFETGEYLVVSKGIAVLTTTSSLGAAVESAIQALITDEKNRDAILAEIETATGLTVEEIGKVVDGSFGCMVVEKRTSLASAIGVEVTILDEASATDGCTDEAEVVDEDELPEPIVLARKEAMKHGFNAGIKRQLLSDQSVIKFKSAKLEAAAHTLEDGSLLYVDTNSGHVYKVKSDLYISELAAPGTYTTFDGKSLVVVSKEVVYDEGTEWEWSYEVSMVDVAASTLELTDYLPWAKESVEAALAATAELKAANDAQQAEMETIKSELQATKAQLAVISNRPVKGMFAKSAPADNPNVNVKLNGKTTPAAEKFIHKFSKK